MRTVRKLFTVAFPAIVAAVLLVGAEAIAAPAAEIVSLQGRGEYRSTASSDWLAAKVKQALEAGQYVRTVQAESRMGLLLADQTQLTLQGISIAQVKTPDGAGPRKSIIEFGKGTGRFQTKTPSKDFTVVTPTGIAAIRGTEWLVEVADDGRSAFTVVEGVIEISNDLGSLSVGADEQGVLEKGKAPTKRSVQDARERVQWVSSFTIDASRYQELRAGEPQQRRLAAVLDALNAGEISRTRALLAAGLERDYDLPVAYFLLADIELYFGRARDAVQWLDKAATRFPDAARTEGLRARALLYADDLPLARESAARARARFPETFESQLFAGEVARLDGDARIARQALSQATRISPEDWRGWLALGQLHADRADYRRARRALDRAENVFPAPNAAILGERGLLEANAYQLPRARETLARALAAQPDDFASWTGMGIAQLKSGDPLGAQESLLKATLIEPRYARAHIYLAVAYWQQGRAADAFAQLRTASRHDPKDPLPWQYASMMHSDLLRPGDAVAAARESIARLPFVKSLDAVANNLRGGANLGAPLAQLGLESWALKNAQDSFDPLWAGSHLFLADRLPGKFAANSELYQGFLSDPLAFGASNRFQSLVSRPGNFATLAWRGAQSSDASLTEPLANVNGLVNDGRLAYFLEGAALKTWRDDRTSEDRATSVTWALGLRPRDDLGFFFYGNRLLPETRAGFTDRGLFEPYQLIDGAVNRIDAGMLYRRGPDSQFWLKGGHGSEDSLLRAHDTSAVGTARFYRDSEFTTQPRRGDLGVRGLHRFGNGIEVSLALEAATWDSIDFLARDAFGRTAASTTRFVESVRQDVRDESRSGELDVRWPVTRTLLVQMQADHTSYDKTNDILVVRDYANQRVPLADNHERERWSPRAGFAWKPVESFTLRAAYQEWLRPASIASLKAPSTAGIALDDRYVLAGGLFERTRVQGEWHVLPDVLVSAFHDRQEIDNLYSPLIGVLNNRPDTTNLERLRNRSFNALASLGLLEGFAELSRGKLTERGASMNALATRQLAIFAEGVWATSENSGALYPGARLALLPKQRYAIGATFFSDRQWSLAAKWIRRGERFADEANTRRLEAEWNGAVQAFWETADKRLSLEAIVTNIGAKSAKESVGLAVNYRF